MCGMGVLEKEPPFYLGPACAAQVLLLHTYGYLITASFSCLYAKSTMSKAPICVQHCASAGKPHPFDTKMKQKMQGA
jgi:hypothetical protein